MPILRPLASAGKRACWLLMGLCLGLPALANEAPVSFNGTSISLEQALERALRSNPELAAVGRETEIASGARQQAGLIPNPDLSWSVEDTRQGNRQTSVSIAQPLELGGSAARGWRWRNAAARSPGPNWKSVAPNCAPRSAAPTTRR